MDLHTRLFLAMNGRPTLDALRALDEAAARRRDAARPAERPAPAGVHKTLYEALGGDATDAPAGAHARLVKALAG